MSENNEIFGMKIIPSKNIKKQTVVLIDNDLLKYCKIVEKQGNPTIDFCYGIDLNKKLNVKRIN